MATQAMIDFALNLHSASGYTVYAERGDNRQGLIRGPRGTGQRRPLGSGPQRHERAVELDRRPPAAAVHGAEELGPLRAEASDPGVYCLSSAELTGEMMLDSAGNAAGTYIFRVAGTLNAKAGSSIRLENGAQGGNVFFVAEEAEIGDNAAFRANILTKGDTTHRQRSDRDRQSSFIGQGGDERQRTAGRHHRHDGDLQRAAAEPDRRQRPVEPDLPLRRSPVSRRSDTAANPLRVPVGSCSSPFDVTAGPQTVTELNNGTLINPANGTFTGGFELVNVVNLTPASTSTLGLVNLATRVANVTIVAGGVNTQLTLQFTNRAAITGFIEICKRAATGPGAFNPAGTNPLSGGDPDVTGFFQYTIEDVYTVNTQNPNVRTLQVFTVPVGQCSGPIAVTKGDPSPTDADPRESWRSYRNSRVQASTWRAWKWSPPTG